MGRKIPGRKHHGVRDPEKQQAERFNRIKDKINAPPANPDEQHIPKSLTRLIELKDRAKDWTSKKKRKMKSVINQLPRCNEKKPLLKSSYEKPIPEFKQLPGETNREFLYRVNRICDHVKKEAAFEQKYKVQVIRNQETGEVEEVVKRPKDEVEKMVSEVRKAKKAKKKRKGNSQDGDKPRLNKSQKRQLKLKAKKQKKTEAKLEDEKEVIRESVGFGETAHAPPTLNVLPRKVAKQESAPRPGVKALLLKSLLGQEEKTTRTTKETAKVDKALTKVRKVTNKVIDKTGKRKDLPVALRRQLEKQQKEVIEAYRKLKGKKEFLIT